MAQDFNLAGLSELDKIGTPMQVGSTLDEHGGLGVLLDRRLIVVPQGQCFLITSIQGNGGQLDGTGVVTSPTLGNRVNLGLEIKDATVPVSYTHLTLPTILRV